MKVLLVPSGNPDTVKAAKMLAARLDAAGLDAVIQPPDITDDPVVPTSDIALAVPMGGDGTFLSTARLLDFASIPLLAFNYGTLAFLSGNPERDEVELVCDALAGDIIFDRRSTLSADIRSDDGSATHVEALNEFVFARGASGRVVEYEYGINGTKIAHLKADGLVISTATGSTGYALSAGGPVVSPGYGGLIVVPVAPHALNTRAIVTSPSDVIEVQIFIDRPQESSIFVDGNCVEIANPASIRVQRSDKEVFVALGGGDFFTNVSRVFFGASDTTSGSVSDTASGSVSDPASDPAFDLTPDPDPDPTPDPASNHAQ